MSEQSASTSTGDLKQGQPTHFNMNKLQAVACMAASAVVSAALLIWCFKTLF
jgi:hypothetical protein